MVGHPAPFGRHTLSKRTARVESHCLRRASCETTRRSYASDVPSQLWPQHSETNRWTIGEFK
jgi:hypothetical protein